MPTPAQRVNNMIKGLEELMEEYREPHHSLVQVDIQKSLDALRRLWKNLVG